MKSSYLVLLVLCLQMGLCVAKAEDRESFSIVSLANGKKFTLSVNHDRMEKTPVWNDEEDVPYPVRKARTVAVQELQKLLANASDYDLDSIALEKTEDRWYYKIQFFKLRGASQGPITPFVVVVLLDGSVVEPEIGPL